MEFIRVVVKFVRLVILQSLICLKYPQFSDVDFLLNINFEKADAEPAMLFVIRIVSI